MSLNLDTQTAKPVASCQILPLDSRMWGNIPIYVRRYARTIHGALVKSFRSCEIVTSDVETIEVSRLEKRSPISKLESSVSNISQETADHLRYDKNYSSRPGHRMLPQPDNSRHHRLVFFRHAFRHCHLTQRWVWVGKRHAVSIGHSCCWSKSYLIREFEAD